MPEFENTYDDPDKLGKANDLSKRILRRYQESNRSSNNSARRSKLKLYNQVYRNYWKVRKSTIRSNFPQPIIMAHIDSIWPRLIENRPRIEVWPRGPEDADIAAMLRAKIFQFWQQRNMALMIAGACKNGLIYGTSILKVYHRKLTAKRTVLREKNVFVLPNGQVLSQSELGLFNQFRVTPEVVLEEIEEDVPIINGPWADLVDIDELFPYPRSVSWDEAPWIIHKHKVTLKTLESLPEDGLNKDVLAKLRERAKTGNQATDAIGWTEEDTSLRDDSLETFGAESIPDRDDYMREWTAMEEWQDEKVGIIIAEEPDLPPVYRAKNKEGLKPFVAFSPSLETNELYGMSWSEKLFSNNFERNLLHNVRMDHAIASAHPMWKVLEGGGQTPRTIRWRNMGTLPVADFDDFQPIQLPPLPFTLYREEQLLDAMAQKVSGAPDAASQGVRQGGEQTATAANIQATAVNVRSGGIFLVLTHQMMIPMGRRLIRIWEVNPPEAENIPVIGPESAAPDRTEADLLPGEFSPGVIRIDPERIRQGVGIDRDLIIDVAFTEPETRQARGQRAINLLQVLGGIPPEMYLNPALRRPLIQALEATGDDFAHETVAQIVSQAQQAQAQQAQAAQAQQGQAEGVPSDDPQQVLAEAARSIAPGAS